MGRGSRHRPSHQTVVAYLALAVVLLTGTAYAAATIGSGDVVNNSLKSADLKNNAGVKGADVPANNLRAADFARGASASIRGADVANNALGANQVSEGNLAASRVVARLGGVVGQPVPNAVGPLTFANNSYTQAINEPNDFIGGGQVTFTPACTTPRSATIYLLIDNPLLASDTILGLGGATDNTGGTVGKQFSLAAFFGGVHNMKQPPQVVATPHQLFLQGDASCNAGSGVTLDSLLVDVIGHR